MGFGGKLSKTSTYNAGEMTFEVSRNTNFIRRELKAIEQGSKTQVEMIKARRDFIAKHMIKGWSGVTEQKLAKLLVTNATHYAAKTFETDGDSVDINRASFDDIITLLGLGNNEEPYAHKARVAIDELLGTKDAYIVYNGKRRKMNASIREEIKADEGWEDVVNAIWDFAASYNDYLKPELSSDEIKYSDSAVNDYLIGAYSNVTKTHLLDDIYAHAKSNENYREKQIQDEEAQAKN